MGKPSNEELLAERRTIADLVHPSDTESNADAVTRLLADLDSAHARLTELETALTQGATDAFGPHAPDPAGSIPAPATYSADAPSSIPDDDPADPRPGFDPVFGWRTPTVLDWAARQAAKRNPEPATV